MNQYKIQGFLELKVSPPSTVESVDVDVQVTGHGIQRTAQTTGTPLNVKIPERLVLVENTKAQATSFQNNFLLRQLVAGDRLKDTYGCRDWVVTAPMTSDSDLLRASSSVKGCWHFYTLHLQLLPYFHFVLLFPNGSAVQIQTLWIWIMKDEKSRLENLNAWRERKWDSTDWLADSQHTLTAMYIYGKIFNTSYYVCLFHNSSWDKNTASWSLGYIVYPTYRIFIPWRVVKWL